MPSERHAAVGQRVPYCVIDNGFAVEACELILPVRVAVGIGYGIGCGKSGYILNIRTIGILRFSEDIPAVIVGIDHGFVAVGIVLSYELVQAVVGIVCNETAVRDRGDVPGFVVGIADGAAVHRYALRQRCSPLVGVGRGLGIGAARQGAGAQAVELIEEAGGAEQSCSRAGDRRHAIDLALELLIRCAVPIQIGLVQLEVSELTGGGQQVIAVVIGIIQACAVRARLSGKATFKIVVIGIRSAVSVVVAAEHTPCVIVGIAEGKRAAVAQGDHAAVAVVPEGGGVAVTVRGALQQACSCIICILR